jgi:nucleoside phosphorylase
MMSLTLAEKRVNDFKNKYGEVALQLAYHAALPVALNADLLHLLRINFFLDPPKPLPYMAEFELLLSPLCREIDEGLYEIEPEIRDILLQGLCSIDNGQRLRDVATLLWQYIDRDAVWIDRVELERAQQFTVLNFLDPEKADRWLAEAETTVGLEQTASREWFVAVSQDRDRTAIYREKAHQEIERSDAAEKVRQEFYCEIIERHFDEIGETIAGVFSSTSYDFVTYSKELEDLGVDEIHMNEVNNVNIIGIVGTIDTDDISGIFGILAKIEFSVTAIHEKTEYPPISSIIPSQSVSADVRVYVSFVNDELEIDHIDLVIAQPILVDYQHAVLSAPDLSEDSDDFNKDEENISDSNTNILIPLKVFISYSHDSQELLDRVLNLSARLRLDGIDCNIDLYENAPPEGWLQWMLNQVESADFVLIVCSEQYYRRFRVNEAYGKGKGATWEGGVIVDQLYQDQGQNSKFIPVVLTSEDIQFIPSPLRSITCYQLYNNDGYESLYRRLTNQLGPILEKTQSLTPRNRKQDFSDNFKLPTVGVTLDSNGEIPKSLSEPIPCALILTALRVEYLAVRSYLHNRKEEIHPQGTIYERGQFTAEDQTWDVSIVEIGAWNSRVALETRRAIAHFNPSIILYVGLAGGIKNVNLGDVVASTKVYRNDSGTAGKRVKQKIEFASYALEQRARAEARKGDWLKRISVTESIPQVHLSPIFSCKQFIRSTTSEEYIFIRSNYSDAVAVDIEGFEFLEAVKNKQVWAMVIRGISDLIGDRTSDRHQEIAARNASAFAFEILAKLKPIVGEEFKPEIVQNYVASDNVIGGKVIDKKTVQNNVQGFQTLVQGGTAYLGEIAPGDRSSQPPSSLKRPTQPSISQIRKLVEATLSEDNLSNLCFDEFPSVCSQFVSGQTKNQRILLIVDFATRHREVPKLLNAIKRINPNAYAEFMSQQSESDT